MALVCPFLKNVYSLFLQRPRCSQIRFSTTKMSIGPIHKLIIQLKTNVTKQHIKSELQPNFYFVPIFHELFRQFRSCERRIRKPIGRVLLDPQMVTISSRMGDCFFVRSIFLLRRNARERERESDRGKKEEKGAR